MGLITFNGTKLNTETLEKEAVKLNADDTETSLGAIVQPVRITNVDAIQPTDTIYTATINNSQSLVGAPEVGKQIQVVSLVIQKASESAGLVRIEDGAGPIPTIFIHIYLDQYEGIVLDNCNFRTTDATGLVASTTVYGSVSYRIVDTEGVN